MTRSKIIMTLLFTIVATTLAEYYPSRDVKNTLLKAEEPTEFYEDEEPNYKYAYQVNDQDTGDFKNHHETREGDLVKGYYSVKEADGTLREVHYTSDKHNGFNAIVKKSGTPTVEPDTVAINHKYEQKRYFLPLYKQHNTITQQQQPQQQVQPSAPVKHFIPIVENKRHQPAAPPYTSEEER